MLAHLFQERIEAAQSVRDDLVKTLPDLFASGSRSTYRQLVIENPQAVFFTESELASARHTALAYSVQPGFPPLDEITIKLARYREKYGWVLSMGTHVADQAFNTIVNHNHTFDLSWRGGYEQQESSKLELHWIYHTSDVTFDFPARTVRFFNDYQVYRTKKELIVPFANLREAEEEIRLSQANRPVAIGDIELPQLGNPYLAMTFIDNKETNPLFNLVIPSTVHVDQARLSQPAVSLK